MKWNPDVSWFVKLIIQLIFIGLGAIIIAFLAVLFKFWWVW